MHRFVAIATAALALVACGPIIPRVDTKQDRVCAANGFPPEIVTAVYQAWGIRQAPLLASDRCELVFTLDESLGRDEAGNAIQGEYEQGSPQLGSQVIRVAPLRSLIPEFRARAIQDVAEHEFGHAMGLGHGNDPTTRMYRFYLRGQAISEQERRAMAQARIRNTAPRTLVGGVSPLDGPVGGQVGER